MLPHWQRPVSFGFSVEPMTANLRIETVDGSKLFGNVRNVGEIGKQSCKMSYTYILKSEIKLRLGWVKFVDKAMKCNKLMRSRMSYQQVGQI